MEKSYVVPNISCGHCTATIERELKLVEGVEEVKAHEESKLVELKVSNESVLPKVEEMLVEIGYPVQK